MGEDWRGRGGGRRGGQPTITGRSSWRGHGKGKAGTKMLGGLIPAPMRSRPTRLHSSSRTWLHTNFEVTLRA